MTTNKKSSIPAEKVFVYIIFALQLPILLFTVLWISGNYQATNANIPEGLPEFLVVHHQTMNCFTSEDPYTGQFIPYTYKYEKIGTSSFTSCTPAVQEIARTRLTFQGKDFSTQASSPNYNDKQFAERISYFPSVPKKVWKDNKLEDVELIIEVQT